MNKGELTTRAFRVSQTAHLTREPSRGVLEEKTPLWPAIN